MGIPQTFLELWCSAGGQSIGEMSGGLSKTIMSVVKAVAQSTRYERTRIQGGRVDKVASVGGGEEESTRHDDTHERQQNTRSWKLEAAGSFVARALIVTLCLRCNDVRDAPASSHPFPERSIIPTTSYCIIVHYLLLHLGHERRPNPSCAATVIPFCRQSAVG